MVSRRTRARLQLLVGALGLAYQLWGYRAGRQYAAAVAAGDRPPREKLQDRHQELIDQTDNIEDVDLWEMMAAQNRAAFAEMYGDTQLQARWVAVGVVRGVVQGLVLDFDIFGTRTSFHRRTLVGLLKAGALHRLFDKEVRHSMSVGHSLGFLTYRIKYGLISEPLGD